MPRISYRPHRSPVRRMKGMFSVEEFGQFPPVDESKDVGIYRGANGTRELRWNRSDVGYHALKSVSIEELEEIVVQEERRLFETRWPKLLEVSSSHPKTIHGLKHGAFHLPWLLSQRGFKGKVRTRLSREAEATLREFLDESLEEQIAFLAARAPSTLPDARKQLNSTGRTLLFRDVMAIRPSECRIRDPHEWLGRFCSVLNSPPKAFSRGYFFCVAFALREKGILLLSQACASAWLTYRGHVGKFGSHFAAISDPYVLAMTDRYARLEKPHWELASFEAGEDFSSISSKRIKARISDLIWTTTVTDLKRDVTWEFAKAFAVPVARAMTSGGITKLLRECALKNAGADTAMVSRHELHRLGARGKPAEVKSYFLSPILSHLPNERQTEFADWLKLFEAYEKSLTIKLPGTISNALGHLTKWLVSRDKIVSPRTFTRPLFRDDANIKSGTLRQYLDINLPNIRFRNDVLGTLARFFDWVAVETPTFKNPILYRLDRFMAAGVRSIPGKTMRGRIESRVLDDLKNFLIIRTAHGFEWSDWVKGEGEVRVNGKIVFCPILPAVLAFLLRWPLRSKQVLWLDSGELDEQRYDFSVRKFVHNSNGIKGRAMGVIAPGDDGIFGDEHQLDLVVAINKRPVGTKGDYSIPYMDEETVWIVSQVLDYQKEYGLPPRLVKESDRSGTRMNPNVKALLPDLCCLFRDRAVDGYCPPDNWAINRYWAKVCDAYDRQNAAWAHPKTGVVGPRPNWPVLSKKTAKDYLVTGHRLRSGQANKYTITAKRTRARYDIHSLRVSGVSYLLDRGIPLDVVGAIAGHASLIMTLHYHVLERAAIRKKMSELLRQNPEFTSEVLRVEERLRKGGDPRSWLRCLTDEGLSILNERITNGGPYQIRTTGICPGTDCASGLAIRSKLLGDDHALTAVPGSYCSLCIYNLYGAPFLPGLVREFNESLYLLQQRARKQLDLRERERNLEAEGRYDEASVLRGEDELLTRRTEADCAHMVRLYEMVQESLLQVGNPGVGDGKAKHALVMLGGAKAVVERAGAFEQMKEILDVNELLPASQSGVPDQIAPAFQNRLLSMLVRNGIEPYLLGLPPEIAKTASLALGDLLIRAVPKREDIESVFSGQRFLRDLGPAVESSVLDGVRLMTARLKEASSNQLMHAGAQQNSLSYLIR